MNGAELRAARATLGLSANALARLVGVRSKTDPGATVRRWERGTDDVPPHVETIIVLCQRSPRNLAAALSLADARQADG